MSTYALGLAGVLAIAGTVAMAVLQILKELTPMRRGFQRSWLERWFAVRAERFSEEAITSTIGAQGGRLPVSATLAQSTLIELATGGEADAFYDLPIEQVVAQANAAAQIALEYPDKYFSLLAVLSQGADVTDVARVVERAEAGASAPAPDREALDARNRVGHRIQRNLDGIQIAIGSRWKVWMQAVSIGLTVVFVELAIFFSIPFDWPTLFVGAVLGVVGGYLAPVTRDVVAALQNLRKG